MGPMGPGPGQPAGRSGRRVCRAGRARESGRRIGQADRSGRQVGRVGSIRDVNLDMTL
jgi:hypothetical protein